MGMCFADKHEKEEKIKFLKELEPGIFTEHTVLAAYEISGQVFSQLTGGHIDKDSPNYEVSRKILEDAKKLNNGQIWPLEDALASMVYPDKPRVYI